MNRNHRRRIASLTVVYDGGCLLCRRSVNWLESQQQAVAIRTLPSSAHEAVIRFGQLANYGDDMIAAADDGRTWVGAPDAYLVVMWALPALRPLSYVLSIGLLKPLVGRVFQILTGNRQAIGGWFGGDAVCEHCSGRVEA